MPSDIHPVQLNQSFYFFCGRLQIRSQVRTCAAFSHVFKGIPEGQRNKPCGLTGQSVWGDASLMAPLQLNSGNPRDRDMVASAFSQTFGDPDISETPWPR